MVASLQGHLHVFKQLGDPGALQRGREMAFNRRGVTPIANVALQLFFNFRQTVDHFLQPYHRLSLVVEGDLAPSLSGVSHLLYALTQRFYALFVHRILSAHEFSILFVKVPKVDILFSSKDILRREVSIFLLPIIKSIFGLRFHFLSSKLLI